MTVYSFKDNKLYELDSKQICFAEENGKYIDYCLINGVCLEHCTVQNVNQLNVLIGKLKKVYSYEKSTICYVNQNMIACVENVDGCVINFKNGMVLNNVSEHDVMKFMTKQEDLTK